MENRSNVSGRIIKLKYEKYSTKGIIEVQRTSGVCDKIPFITKQNFDALAEWVTLKGRLQTRNSIGKDGKVHKNMHIYAEEVIVNEEPKERNEIEFDGFLVRKDVLRETPKGRRIMDAVLAINDLYGSQYPAVILWESLAEKVSKLPIGAKISVFGRFQSREYVKEIDGVETVKTAYEISIRSAQVL